MSVTTTTANSPSPTGSRENRAGSGRRTSGSTFHSTKITMMPSGTFIQKIKRQPSSARRSRS